MLCAILYVRNTRKIKKKKGTSEPWGDINCLHVSHFIMCAKNFPTPAVAMLNWIASALPSTSSNSLQAAKVSSSAHFC